jgi:Tol biopolymer transport system component
MASPDNYDNASIEAVVLATKERRVLVRGASMARYVDPGYLVFVRGRVAYAVKFDADRLQTTGSPVALMQDLAGDATTGAAHFAISRAGTFAYLHGATDTEVHRLVWVDRNGRVDPVDLPPGTYLDMKLSPDAKRVAIQQVAGGGSDIWIYEFARKSFTRLTFGGTNRTPIWSPDGSMVYWVLLNANASGVTIMRRPSDGSAAAETVATSRSSVFLEKLSADGRSAFVDYSNDHGSSARTDIGMLPLQREATPQPLIATNFDEFSSSLSPDGRWIAYQSDETSRFEIYVSDASGHGGRWQISTQGGEEPRWSGDGHELYYRNDTLFMSVPLEAAGTFQAGTPKLLFDGVYNMRTDSGISYGVDSKNGRFLMYRLTEGAGTPTSIRVITNWSSGLRDLVK